MRTNKTATISVLALATACVASAAQNALPDLRDIRLDGYVGTRLRSCIENHVVKTDGVYLTDPYRWRTEKGVLGQVHALGGAVRAHDGRRAAAREH